MRRFRSINSEEGFRIWKDWRDLEIWVGGMGTSGVEGWR